MPTTPDEKLLAILQEHFNPREDGWVWLALYRDGDEGGVVNQIEGAYDGAAEAARALAFMINRCGVERSYLALCRREGRPTESDRELWRGLRASLDPELLVDMVVFNRQRSWSMRAEDAAAVSASGGRGGS